MFHICILYSLVYHRVEACVELACVPIFLSLSLFFFLLFARHVTPRSFFIRFDSREYIYMYTWRDLKLIEIQIETNRQNYFLLAIKKIYSN